MSKDIITPPGKNLQHLQKKWRAKTKKWSKWKRRGVYFLVGMGVMVVVLPLVAYSYFWVSYNDQVYPGVVIANENVSGMTKIELVDRLEERADEYQQQWPLALKHEQQDWLVPYDLLKIDYKTEETADEALKVGRQGQLVNKLKSQWYSWQNGNEVELKYEIDDLELDSLVATLAAVLDVPEIKPEIQYLETTNNKGDHVELVEGAAGEMFESEVFENELRNSIRAFEKINEELVVKVVETKVDEAMIVDALNRAEALVGKELVLVYEDHGSTNEWRLNDEELIGFVGFESEYDSEQLEVYVVGVAESVNREPQNAKFQFNQDSGKAEEFVPAKDGLKVNIEETAKIMATTMSKLMENDTAEAVEIKVAHTKPEVTLAEVNDLGLNELLGRGESTFFGSIPSRVHNVGLAASRINGTLVKPNEEFSFNQSVGEIDGSTGYQSAYIIKDGRTEKGDGGGVCQDSTTMFRAALNAGLPITLRSAHSYRVGYYEQNTKAGLDATVYSPSTDFRFLNDTPGHILIQAEADLPNRSLVIDIYGTSDGRTSEISNHKVWDVTPPPPDVNQEDPSLPKGTVKQVDWKAWGAKAKFDYTVTNDGETLIDKTFYSNYKPWAAVYLVGTGE